MSLTPRQKLAAAISRVTDAVHGWAPYFGCALRGFIRREMDPAMCAAMDAVGMAPTLAVTKDGILFWAASFVEQQTVEVLAWGLMHETMHVLLQHHVRASAIGVDTGLPEEVHAKRQIANSAQDACINEELDKFQRGPDWALRPATLEQPPGLIFEERYRLLLEKVKKQGGGKGKSGKSSGSVGKGHCGGCAGNPVPGEPNSKGSGSAAGASGASGASGAPTGRTQAEMDRMRKETAEAVKAHTASKGRGTVPDSLERWADEQLAPPKVDWRKALAQAVRAAVAYKSGCVDLSWHKMSRRQAGVGFGPGRPVLPAYRAPVPRTACIVDTSGSMGKAELTAALSEVQGVLAAVGAPAVIVACDAAVHGIQEVSTVQAAAALLKGGGGTSMLPAFEALEKRNPQPSVVICMTDGHIGDGRPEFEPSWCRTVWVVLGVGGNKEPCPWGEVLVIDPEDVEERAA